MAKVDIWWAKVNNSLFSPSAGGCTLMRMLSVSGFTWANVSSCLLLLARQVDMRRGTTKLWTVKHPRLKYIRLYVLFCSKGTSGLRALFAQIKWKRATRYSSVRIETRPWPDCSLALSSVLTLLFKIRVTFFARGSTHQLTSGHRKCRQSKLWVTTLFPRWAIIWAAKVISRFLNTCSPGLHSF